MEGWGDVTSPVWHQSKAATEDRFTTTLNSDRKRNKSDRTTSWELQNCVILKCIDFQAWLWTGISLNWQG